MAKTEERLDPMTPVRELTIGGKTYKLAFTFEALGAAQREARRSGIRANLLVGLTYDGIDPETLPLFLYSALRMHHAKVSLQQAATLITMENFGQIFSAVWEAYAIATGSADEEAKDGKDATVDPDPEPAE